MRPSSRSTPGTSAPSSAAQPTAAALAYGLDKGSEDETVLVFDLGGVLVDWDPRYLYRKIFDDEAAMEGRRYVPEAF